MSLAEVELMEPEEPEAIPLDAVPIFGQALYGTRWQSDLAKALGYSKSQLSRFLLNTRDAEEAEAAKQAAAAARGEKMEPIEKRRRVAPPNFSAQLQGAILEKVLELAGLLDTPGLPKAGTQEMRKAQDNILIAVRLLRGEIKLRQR